MSRRRFQLLVALLAVVFLVAGLVTHTGALLVATFVVLVVGVVAAPVVEARRERDGDD